MTWLSSRSRWPSWSRVFGPRSEAARPWLETTSSLQDADEALDLAFVPFSLGGNASPIGCLVFGQRPDQPAGPVSHRLADLIDATEFIVTALRPAIEHAETTNAAILGLR